MAVYLCRWPNGDCSIVAARNKGDAIERLDEWGDAEGCPMWRLDECMIDFTIDGEGRLVLNNIGEYTTDTIMQKCYPVLETTLMSADRDEEDHLTESGREQIRDAIEQEKKRVSSPRTRGAETEVGREIQTQLGAPSRLINRMVREGARRTLEEFDGGKNKPS